MLTHSQGKTKSQRCPYLTSQNCSTPLCLFSIPPSSPHPQQLSASLCLSFLTGHLHPCVRARVSNSISTPWSPGPPSSVREIRARSWRSICLATSCWEGRGSPRLWPLCQTVLASLSQGEKGKQEDESLCLLGGYWEESLENSILGQWGWRQGSELC